ncbi:NAD(P)-dependent oxidoreductase [Streptosporangium saharense]|uniref:NAD(P)-dependent oxidoreductase n=1 Tax=Streptosporangium saharense TaxID=1706840 RepID=UPI0034223CBE
MSTNEARSGMAGSKSVGVLGLGNMGLGIAITLKAAGWDVSGYDPDLGARRTAGNHGVACADEGLPTSEALVLSLPSAATVRQVIPELLKAGPPRVVIDTTTSDPRTSGEMENLCERAGGHFVDAPVSGGRAGAWSGRLTAFVGGSEVAVEAASAVLTAFTSQWSHLGPVGSGNVVKLLNNMLCAANMASVAEAIDVLSAYGLDVPRSLAALNTGSGRSSVSTTVFEDSILRGELTGGFTVGLMTRDVELGLAAALEGGARPAVLSAAVDSWRGALERLGPAADCNVAPSAFTTATRCLDPAELRREPVRSAGEEEGAK